MIRYYNSEQIVSVKVFDKRKEYAYKWYEGTTLFFLFDDKKEGYYNVLSRMLGQDTPINAKEYDTLIFTKEQVYEKPRVEISFSNDKVLTKHFETYPDAMEYAAKHLTDKFFQA